MAEKPKTSRRVKPAETLRERAAKSSVPAKPRRVRRVIGAAGKPVRAVNKAGRREFHLPLPDNQLGRLLGRRVRFMPKFFGEAWAEVRQVSWPSNQETLKLSLAVFIFAIAFGGLIYAVDYGLERLFREVLIG